MKAIKNMLAVAVAAAVIAPSAHAWEPSVYGSLRIAVESVDLDDESAEGDYIDLRDAYSRFGGSLSHDFENGNNLLFQAEIPLDLANVAIARPDVETEDTRIFKAQLSGEYGTVWIGQDWTPFYNNIHYPVDYFNSYYSGFTNPSATRQPDSVAYISPRLNGFQFSTLYSKDLGVEDQEQYVVSYATDSVTVALGYQSGPGFEATDTNIDGIFGASIAYTTGPWYFAAKTEIFDSNIEDNSFGEDGSASTAVIGQYTSGKNTYRALVAQYDNFGENIVQLGFDHQYTDDIKFFVEYYYEEEQSAIGANAGESTFNPEEFQDTSGGQVLTAGIRYDFKLL